MGFSYYLALTTSPDPHSQTNPSTLSICERTHLSRKACWKRPILHSVNTNTPPRIRGWRNASFIPAVMILGSPYKVDMLFFYLVSCCCPADVTQVFIILALVFCFRLRLPEVYGQVLHQIISCFSLPLSLCIRSLITTFLSPWVFVSSSWRFPFLVLS